MLVDAVTWGVGLVVGVPAHNKKINMEGHHGVVPVVAGDNWVKPLNQIGRASCRERV